MSIDSRQGRPNDAPGRPTQVTLTIDGKTVSVERGTTVLRAAIANGIYIPHLCDYRDLTPFAGCRTCLVEIEGSRGIDTSCTVQCREGMVVRTNTIQLKEHRLGVLEVLLSDHPDRCLNCPRMERCPPFVVCQRDDLVTDRCVTCPRNKQCELQRVVDFTGWRSQRFSNERRSTLPDRTNPFIEMYPDYCIFCARCTRVCDEIIGASAIDLARRGPTTTISVQFDRHLTESPCIFCGACAIVCPTGALMKADVTFGRIPEIGVPTTCSYCGVGCGLFLNLKGGRLISASPDVDDPASSGYLCVRGQFGYDYTSSRERLKSPLVRRGSDPVETSWDEALDLAVERLATIVERDGPDAVGVIGSGKITNEEAYLVQKLARAALGTNNVDHTSGQMYQAPTIAALGEALGVPAMTMPTADLEKSGCILVVGSNTMETHPVLFFKIQKAVRRGARLILIDPRASTPKRFASSWLQVRPGGDLAALNGILRIVLDDNLVDDDFVTANCEGFDALAAQVREKTAVEYAALAGVSIEELRKAAHLYAKGGAAPEYPIPDSWYGLFVTPGQRPATRHSAIVYAGGLLHHPDAVAAVQALANLTLLTGMIGKEGAGICPLAGQNNTQGACDVGQLPNYWPGYVPVGDADLAKRLTEEWGVVPTTAPGASLTEMLAWANDGRLKGLLVVGANLARSAPGTVQVEAALDRLEFLAVADLFPQDTTRRAQVVFPSAAAAEKDGTFTNTERRVQRVRAALPPVGSSRPDWSILAELGRRLARRLGRPARFDYVGPADVLNEIARVVPSYGGISYAKIDQRGVQWPCPTPDHPGTPYLFADGFGARKARLVPARPTEQTASPDYPFRLSIGRDLQFNTGVISDHSRRLAKMREAPVVEIHPSDAASLGLADGDRTRLTSAHGSLVLRVQITRKVRPGQVFAYLAHPNAPANALTALVDEAGMPELKAVPVQIERIGL